MRTQGPKQWIGKVALASFVLSLALALSGCTSDKTAEINVAGTWRSEVLITSCEPAGACEDAGFVQGANLFAELTLTQVRSDLNGTYAYDGSSITVPVSGRVGEGVVAVNGAANIPFGSMTVNFSGTKSGDTMPATVTHQITFRDGRAANIAVSGTFTR